MTLPSSGAISLNQMHTEVGGSSGTTVSINDADIRAMISKSAGAQMSFNEWYGASSGGGGGGSDLFSFTSFTFTSPNEDPWAPSSSDITSQTAYSNSNFASNTSYFQVFEGIQYFTIPTTGSYRITCAGPAGKNARYSSYIGYGGIVRGDFSLNQSNKIAMLVGQRPPNSGATNRAWQGGAGATFVTLAGSAASGSNTTASPLLVSGGGGHCRESAFSSRANCDANMGPDGKNGSASIYKNPAIYAGTQGTKADPYGHNAGGGGGACGWAAEQASVHGDTRNLYVPTGYPGNSTSTAYLPARGFLYSGDPGRAGLFNTNYDQSYRGSAGFGGGGAGGWGGEGGAAGYSGGGNGHNSSVAWSGGGGSFILSTATNIGTSTGSWTIGSGYYSGHSGLSTSSGLTNLGYNQTGNGYVTIEKL